MKVCDIVQEAGIKTIPKKKKCSKAKWFSEEGLQIAERRREAKGRGQKERYTHQNAVFQRIAGEVRKPSSVISAKNRRKQQNGKDQRSLQENKRYQGSTSCKDGHNKGQKCMDLTETEDIKRWQEYTEELYKKDLQTQISRWCDHSLRARHPGI